MVVKIDKSKYRLPEFVAEYSMGALDYERYHRILSVADALAFRVLMKDIDAIKPFYSILLTFYSNLSPLIHERHKGKLIDMIKKVNILFKDYEEKNKVKRYFPETLANELIFLWQELLFQKQMVGLGATLRKKETLKAKLKRAAGLV